MATNTPVPTPASGMGQSPGGWTASDWREFFDERAAVTEYDGGMSREKAERMAYESCITRWLDMHPPAHAGETTCPHCLQPNGAPGTSCVPTLTGSGGHLWLHPTCLDAWLARRRKEAVASLEGNGVF